MTEDLDQLPRSFRGTTAKERPVYQSGPHAPWHATITVTPVLLRKGRTFEIVAEWHDGPPAAGSPPTTDGRPVGVVQDVYSTQEEPLAKAIAVRAEEELRAGRVPDLRAIATAAKFRVT